MCGLSLGFALACACRVREPCGELRTAQVPDLQGPHEPRAPTGRTYVLQPARSARSAVPPIHPWTHSFANRRGREGGHGTVFIKRQGATPRDAPVALWVRAAITGHRVLRSPPSPSICPIPLRLPHSRGAYARSGLDAGVRRASCWRSLREPLTKSEEPPTLPKPTHAFLPTRARTCCIRVCRVPLAGGDEAETARHPRVRPHRVRRALS